MTRYAVVEYNQASGRPSLVEGSLVDERDEAVEIAQAYARELAVTGRRERYVVAAVEIERDEFGDPAVVVA